jgi:hypothetical protein
MSVGLFMGIVPSYTEEAEDSARELIAAINSRLQEQNLPLYSEPDEPPDVYVDDVFGRSELDHHSASCFVQLAEIAEGRNSARQHLAILGNPYRAVFLPQDFGEPFETGYKEEIFGDLLEVWTGSAQRLLDELTELAPHLGIPLENSVLSDEVAAKINEFELLTEDDDGELAEDERTAWLALYEGARLAVENKVALSLAG